MFSDDEKMTGTPQDSPVFDAPAGADEINQGEAEYSAEQDDAPADINAAQADNVAEEPPFEQENAQARTAAQPNEIFDDFFSGSSVNPLAEDEPSANLKKKNPDRIFGILIGVSLLLIACACLLLATTLNIGSSKPGSTTPAPGGQSQEVPPSQSSTVDIPIYDVPRGDDTYTTEYIVDQIKDSIVGILIYDTTSITPSGSATGIIMSEDGYIITNAHVVVDAAGLTAVMYDGSKYSAVVVGYDEKTDLAVIKVNADGLHPADFGDSDDVVVGERAIAIGNPGGLANSVTQGIISATDREISIQLSDATYANLNVLQTDAAINPGNSGGPLVNAYGQVVGINSSKIVSNGFEGIGFSIPINDAKPIIENLISYGYVKDRAVLGISVIALDSTNGPANGLPSEGLYIAQVMDYSDLANYGITTGDVILKANGVETFSLEDLSEQLALFVPGQTIELEIYKAYDGSTVTLDVILLDSKAGQ